jgi:LPPG:FO 2-phospho-L-lactate transferase
MLREPTRHQCRPSGEATRLDVVTVTALAGGVGGAKLLVGLAAILDEGDLTAVVNTGDDAVIYGVHVSPDIDIVTYWLAGVADTHRGWGIKDDTFAVVDALDSLGAPAWFRLGDRDLATCLYRTRRLRDGAPLSVVTDEIRRALGVTSRVLPATDDPVRTHIRTADHRTLEFQECSRAQKMQNRRPASSRRSRARTAWWYARPTPCSPSDRSSRCRR